MNRRPFLQKISLLTSAISLTPYLGFGKTNSSKASPLKFITASDGHFGQPNTDFNATHQQLMAAINQEENVDFVVFNGDLIHDEPKWMPEVKKFYDTLKYPYYVTKGNHDRISNSAWLSIWGKPEDFAFIEKDQTGVILLNCSNEAGEYLCANVEFAKSKLEEYKNLPRVFIFVHISQKDWTRNGISCEDLMNLIAGYPNVKATFHGHDHDLDGIMFNQKKPYLWAGHFGGNWGNPFPTYRVCEVNEDGKITTYLKTVKDGTILNRHAL
jgi:predicted MPP superfamily phosphohydrolase